MAYKLFTDGGAQLRMSVWKELDIQVIPFYYIIDGVATELDPSDESLDVTDFYKSMREGVEVSTSMASLGQTKQTFEETLQAGFDIVYVAFSSALSNNYYAMTNMMGELAEQYPERKVVWIDSRRAAGGQGLVVEAVARKLASGMSLDDIKEWTEEARNQIAAWFTVDDLMYLYRGGRVSRSSAWAGSMLNIKPVLYMEETGSLVPVIKARGRKKAINTLADKFGEEVGEATDDTWVLIGHADCLKDAESLCEKLSERYGLKHFEVQQLSPIIGAHCGPDLLTIFWYRSNEFYTM